MSVKVRFAPSPTGLIHLGNIRAALVNWLFARQQGGEFILRIDDTDVERSTKENEAAIKEDLTWMGLTWDKTFNQSDRFDRYNAVVAELKAAGRLYPCYETGEELDMKRKIQMGRGLPPVYDRAGLSLTDDQVAAYEAEGRTAHWRFKLDIPGKAEWTDLIRGPVSIDLSSVSDPILIRGDGSFLYTLPSVIDDVDHGITHIVNCAKEVPCYVKGTFEYLQLRLEDPDVLFESKIEEMCHFVDKGRRSSNVLVHCTAAVSRSPAMILAYLCHLGDTLENAVKLMGKIVQTNPDELFLQQIAHHFQIKLTATELEKLHSI